MAYNLPLNKCEVKKFFLVVCQVYTHVDCYTTGDLSLFTSVCLLVLFL